ncbi:hypothetical protein [Pseudanabaena sp. PCC 6802]|nr:hypothetical protein [Pseudanabaena sp. PCC 6802]
MALRAVVYQLLAKSLKHICSVKSLFGGSDRMQSLLAGGSAIAGA